MRKIACFTCVLLFGVLTAISAVAGERWVFILCQPDSWVNAREKPQKSGDSIGRLECGQKILTDGRERNGYLHCIRLSFEISEGWVSKGYIVSDEPQARNQLATVRAGGRVACRRGVNGSRKGWVRPGAVVKITASSSEWAVTNKGFIRREYLDEGDW